jgi:hypothetical protein
MDKVQKTIRSPCYIYRRQNPLEFTNRFITSLLHVSAFSAIFRDLILANVFLIQESEYLVGRSTW